MKGQTVLLDQVQGRKAAALMVDGQLEDLWVSSEAPPPGTIYRARADRPVKGQGGMFLTTPDGPAFLRQVRGLAPGAILLVQVTGYAEKGKALPVTQKLLFKSRYAIVTPGAPGRNISRSIKDDDIRDRLAGIAADAMGEDDDGLILRSSCAGAPDGEIADDILQMRELSARVTSDTAQDIETLVDGDDPHTLAWREWTDAPDVISEPGCFVEHGAQDAIDAALSPIAPLPGGGSLIIEATRAFVAVDVNTGRDTSPTAGLKANLACARLLPKELRLRGLGGQIVIDMAPMPRKARREVDQTLNAAFRRDVTETSVLGWTALGHVELQRKRDRPVLSELLSNPDG